MLTRGRIRLIMHLVYMNFFLGNSSTTSKAIQHKTPKQTFGNCKQCQKNEIKTMHVQCRHLTCCFTCAKDCKRCPQCGLPSDEEKNKHLAIYACKKMNLNYFQIELKSFIVTLLNLQSSLL